jgi:hypothetical protein
MPRVVVVVVCPAKEIVSVVSEEGVCSENRPISTGGE